MNILCTMALSMKAWRAGALFALLAAALMFTPPPPVLEANSPPAAPTGLAAAAGNGSVTLSWAAADPNDNVTYYEYNVNHNDTSTGNLSGWSQWETVPGSGSSTTSHTFSGLTNGREYRYHLRAVNANGVSVGAPASGPPWFVKAVPSAPPAAPTGLAASAGVASVTLTWNDPGDSSITHYEYNVNHNATGTGNLTGWSAWETVPGSGASTTSHTFTGLAGGREYRYHLRAVNGNGPSVGAPASGPPWFASATPIAPPPPPAPPTNLRVERVCDHKLKVRWHRSSGATGYDLEIGSANRKHWKRLLTNWHGNSWYATNWQKDRSYRFIARAVNDGGSSEWVESALSVAPPCAVGNLSVVTSTPGEGDIGAAGGDISASWNAGKRASAYNLHYNGSRLESGLTATSHSWSVGSRGASDSVSVQSVNGNMTSPSSSADVAWLTASNVKGTTATLDLAGHSGDWYVKRAAPTPAGSCESAGSGTTHSLSGLTASTAHTFTAYNDSSCANAMATTTFTTKAPPPPHVTNLHSVSNPNPGSHIKSTLQQGVAFTTGSHSSGYTLGSVTISMKKVGSPTQSSLALTLHSMEGTNPYNSTSSYPSSTTLATLSENAPTSTSYADTIFTCSGSGCNLSPGTTYFVVATYTGSDRYEWRYFGSDVQSGYPPGHGWTIERSHQKHSGSNWTSWGDWHMVRVDFQNNTTTLTVSSITATGATLTIGNHTGAWYYKATTGPHTDCQSVVSAGTDSKAISGLTPVTSYTYSAYSDSGCNTLLATASAFTTDGVSVSNLGETAAGSHGVGGYNYSAPFTVGSGSTGHTLDSVTLRFGAKVGSPGNIAVKIYNDSSGEPGSEVANISLTGPLSPDSEDATYTCSGSGCSLSAGTYHLHLSRAGNTGNYPWSNTASDDETNVPSNGDWSIGNSGHRQTAGQGYWNSQSNVGMFKVVATVNRTLTASSITATTATLTIAGHTDAWYYKATTGPHTTCQGPVAAGTDNTGLTGLSSNTSYTYSAYKDSGCSTLITTASQFTTTNPSLTASLTDPSGNTYSLTLTISGWTPSKDGGWYYKHQGESANACSNAGTSTTVTYRSIFASGTSFTYSAYSGYPCNSGNLIVSAPAVTTP